LKENVNAESLIETRRKMVHNQLYKYTVHALFTFSSLYNNLSSLLYALSPMRA